MTYPIGKLISVTITCWVCTWGCDSKSGSTGQSKPAPQRATIICEFYDGAAPIPPAQWAEMPPPESLQADTSLFASLRIQEIYVKRRDEEDPTPHFIQDADAILKLGGAARIPLRFEGDLVQEGVRYLDHIVLPSGQEILVTDLAVYFVTIARAAKAKELQDLEANKHMSSCLLNIGYNVYDADSDIGSAELRWLVLSSCWHAAFALREQQAILCGDTVAAAKWSVYSKNLETASRNYQAAIRRRIETK